MTLRENVEAERPKVSVLMPAWNAEKDLSEAIESVLDQTFEDFEFLIYEDASTDRTKKIAEDWAAQDSRIRVLHGMKNVGIVDALNALIEEARGLYLARMDADDIALPFRFGLQEAFLDSHPDVVVVGGQQEWMDEDGYSIGPVWSATEHEEIDQLHLDGHTNIGHPTAMMRRSAVVEAGGYDPKCAKAEDLDLWLRLAERGRLANLHEIVLRYRLSTQGISGSGLDAQKAAARRACEAAWARRGVTGNFGFGDWRPSADRASRLKFSLLYGWRAWSYGNRATWRRYALRALRLAPLNPSAWRLAAFGAIKRPPMVSFKHPNTIGSALGRR
jgi:glycosyltransferase involved in cell wall biosynthesis